MSTTLPPLPSPTSTRPTAPSSETGGNFPSAPPRRSPWRRRLTTLLVLIGLPLAAYQSRAAWWPTLVRFAPWLGKLPVSERKLDGLVLETVKRGPFQITVTERGTLDSMRNAVLTSKVEGSTTIISIVKEGEHVKEGDLVVELDSSALQDKLTQQQIAVTNAKSQLDTAMENVEIQKQQNASDIAAAELKLKLAQLDLENYEKADGDFAQQKRELEAQLTLARDKLAQAKEQEEYFERLVKKGFKTQNELNAVRITKRTEEINVEVALNKLKLLEEATYVRTITELKANAEEYARDLQRWQAKAKAALSQKEAELEGKRLAYQIELDRLERLQAQIAACKIYAPQDGQVIYANQRDGRSSDQVLIEEGATVRERQPIVTLPDLTAMKVNARVHESRISLMRKGLPVTVKVDAFPDETFRGEVDAVASVPSSTGSSFMRDIKEYEATIRILDENEKVSKLRPGLTAQLEVLVESRDDVLQAPIQAVLNIVGQQIAFVVNGKTVERRDVTVGQTNDRFVEILSGLAEGDLVVMNPRSHFEREIKEYEAELIKRQADKPQTPPGMMPPVEPAGSDRPAARPDRPNGPPSGPSESAPGPGGPVPGGPAPGSEGRPRGPGGDPVAFFERMDKDGNGKLSGDELPEFLRARAAEMDTDGDGAVTLEEFKTARARFSGGGRPGGAAAAGGSE
uniref:HlyD family efflux transporter periplasmic adaptor subunit n=1 Tax=Schlesneria paludicola TaxID=360056 RepID=A0A7C4QT57_9PLAN